MKLIRHGLPGQEKPGLLLPDGSRIDTSEVTRDYDESFFASGGLTRLAAWSTTAPAAPLVPEDARWAAPVARPSKIVCAGLNYRDHAIEAGMAIPSEPILFMKASTSFCGPNDDVLIPPGSEKTDWEVELAFVIGKKATRISEADATAHIAGYTILNDLSERAYQLERSGQWTKGKGCDTFAPCGPFLATPEEIGDPHTLGLSLKVNGQTIQNSTTAQLIFQIPFLLSYISHFMTLLPGDVISTGTPPGVGMGLKPPRFLRPGDVMELAIDGLGTQRQTAVATPA